MRRRGDINDPRIQAVLKDPAVLEAVESKSLSIDPENGLERELGSTSDKNLKSWVTVCAWEDDSGNVTETVLQNGHSSLYEVRALLHAALWQTAQHQDKNPA